MTAVGYTEEMSVFVSLNTASRVRMVGGLGSMNYLKWHADNANSTPLGGEIGMGTYGDGTYHKLIGLYILHGEGVGYYHYGVGGFSGQGVGEEV